MRADKEVCRRSLPDDQVDLVVEGFRMLADGTRVRILWALIDRELSVNELAAQVRKPPASVSQHLAKLRMTIYTAEPGSSSEDALKLLASWAATTPDAPAPATDRP